MFLEILNPLLEPGNDESLSDLERQPDEIIGGSHFYRITFRMDMMEFIKRLGQEEFPGAVATGRAELFIDKESLMPHRLIVECEGCLSMVFDQDGDLLTDFTLSRFNQPVHIPSPEDEHAFVPEVEPDDHGNEASTASSILLDQEVEGIIDPQTDVDFFSFDAGVDQAYAIMVILETLVDSELNLYDVNGSSQLAYNDDYGVSLGSQIIWATPATGIYYVAVQGYGRNERGSYKIALTTWSGLIPTPEPERTPMPTPTAASYPTPTHPPLPTATSTPATQPTPTATPVRGSGDGQFDGPLGIAVDGSGNVYVTDNNNNRVQVFSASGTFLRKWGSEGGGDGQFDGPWGIAVDGSGNVYVADSGNRRIQKFNASGEFLLNWGSQGSGDGQFQFAVGIALDASGNVYVADNGNYRIQKFSASGEFLLNWGSEGSADGQFRNPHGIAIDGSGNVYVTDWLNDRVQVFSASGVFLRKWGSRGSGDGQFGNPDGIAVDGFGNVYVVDHFPSGIQVFSASGVFLRKWGSHGSGEGQFQGPWGIAVDGSGNVYVADFGNHRIQVFSASGEFLRKWGAPMQAGTGAPTPIPAPAPTPTAARPAPTPTLSPTGDTEVVSITHRENPYVFQSDIFNFEVNKTYALTFAPPGEFHTFTVRDLGIDIFINAGEAVQVDVTPSEVGTFQLICVPHEGLGMVGEVNVR